MSPKEMVAVNGPMMPRDGDEARPERTVQTSEVLVREPCLMRNEINHLVDT